MKSIENLRAIPDDDLLLRLASLVDDSRHTEADLVAHIAEVEARRLYAREATPSMFQYCTERLHLSGAEAYLRIAAGRAARAHPIILTMLADGRLHLTAIALLAPHLTPENRDVLLARATHKTKREVEELLAEIAPRPDAPALIRMLPETRIPGLLSPALPSSGWCCLGVAKRTTSSLDSRASTSSDSAAETAGALKAALSLDEVVSNGLHRVVAQPATVRPLSPARYKVQFTASAELRDKLERLRALMRSSVPDGDLAEIIDAAVTEKLERLEAQRFARTKRPRKTLSDTDTSPRTREVPAAVKRTVDARDGGRCAYIDEQGRRCTARVILEFHHRRTFATGGDHEPANLSLLCRGHNRYLAGVDYGRGAMAAHVSRSTKAPWRSSDACLGVGTPEP